MRNQYRYLILTLYLLLAGCVSLPEDFEQTPSYAWDAPRETVIGAFFAEAAPAEEGLSGVRLISGPREAFRARFGFARQAEKTLDLQYYLWKGDITGRALLYQVFQAADRGVKVRILIDDIYHSGRDVAYAVIDSHPNIQVRVFNPNAVRGLGRNLNFLGRKSQLNHRMHNKIFLVDSAAAILGGRNIGDDYFGIDPRLNFHDLDVLAVGPAAREAGRAYDLYWNSRGAVPIGVLHDQEVPAGALADMRRQLDDEILPLLAEIPYAVPLEKQEWQERLLHLSEELTWAPSEVIVDPLKRFGGGTSSAFVDLSEHVLQDFDDEIVVQTAYLIPTQEGIDDVAEHVTMGKRFRILTNSMQSNNHLSVHAHYMKYRKPLLEAGIELYELKADNALIEYYKETESRAAGSHAGLHTKAMVVDGDTALIGSYNMDPRSRIWNSEIGLLVHSEAFAQQVLEEMNEEFTPENAWRLSLDADGKLLWSGRGPEGEQIWTHDPGAPWWRRAMARVISWVPIEEEL